MASCSNTSATEEQMVLYLQWAFTITYAKCLEERGIQKLLLLLCLLVMSGQLFLHFAVSNLLSDSHKWKLIISRLVLKLHNVLTNVIKPRGFRASLFPCTSFLYYWGSSKSLLQYFKEKEMKLIIVNSKIQFSQRTDT